MAAPRWATAMAAAQRRRTLRQAALSAAGVAAVLALTAAFYSYLAASCSDRGSRYGRLQFTAFAVCRRVEANPQRSSMIEDTRALQLGQRNPMRIVVPAGVMQWAQRLLGSGVSGCRKKQKTHSTALAGGAPPLTATLSGGRLPIDCDPWQAHDPAHDPRMFAAAGAGRHWHLLQRGCCQMLLSDAWPSHAWSVETQGRAQPRCAGLRCGGAVRNRGLLPVLSRHIRQEVGRPLLCDRFPVSAANRSAWRRVLGFHNVLPIYWAV